MRLARIALTLALLLLASGCLRDATAPPTDRPSATSSAGDAGGWVAPTARAAITCGARCGVVTATQRASEPSVAINPKDPDQILVAATEGTGSPLPGQVFGNNPAVQHAGWAYLTVRASRDGGMTWTRVALPYAGTASPSSAWSQFCVAADPVVLFGPAGKAYLFGIGWPCSVNQRPVYPSTTSVGSVWMSTSADAGTTWSEPGFVTRSPGSVEWPDKEWAAIDPASGRILVVWQGILNGGDMILRYATSADDGRTWSTPGKIMQNSQDQSNAVLMPVPAFGAASTAHVAFQGCSGKCLKVASSTDLVAWRTATVADVTVVERSGAARLLTWVPSIAFDRTTGSLAASWQGGENGSDVWLATSSDNGGNWTLPLAVNEDTVDDGTDQFMSWMATDGAGSAHLFYYDRAAGNATRARYARVDLVNLTTEVAEASPAPEPLGTFMPFNGDYQGAAAIPGRAVVAWAQHDAQGNRQVFASVFDG